MQLEELRNLLFELRTKQFMITKENAENREEKLRVIKAEIKRVKKENAKLLIEQKEGEKKK